MARLSTPPPDFSRKTRGSASGVFKSLMPNTRLSMLLRGQSLVGYRNYADDVVDKFVERSAENGIDIFRVFDALNYEPNIERAAAAVKRSGKHLQLAICYTIGEGERMGGDTYNLEYYLSKARSFRDMGADSICIKDMGGLLAPYDAYELVTAIKSEIDLPLQLHAHYTSGMASHDRSQGGRGGSGYSGRVSRAAGAQDISARRRANCRNPARKRSRPRR